MLVHVFHDGIGNKVSNGLGSFNGLANFCGGNVVCYPFMNDVDIFLGI